MPQSHTQQNIPTLPSSRVPSQVSSQATSQVEGASHTMSNSQNQIIFNLKNF